MTKPQSPPPSNAPFAARGSNAEIEQGETFTPKFDEHGLIAGLAVDAASGDVLMLAWMNADALTLTIETGVAYFWSRSRQKLWRKGEESGNELKLVELLTDCDQDAILMRVEVQGGGVACHTGARSCFYRSIPFGNAASADSRLTRITGAKPSA